MKIIYRKRGEGKTSELVKLAEKYNAYIIVRDRTRAENVARVARFLGKKILFPVTVGEYMQNKMKGSFVRNVLIDDAEDVLQYIFNSVCVCGISLTDPGTEADK